MFSGIKLTVTKQLWEKANAENLEVTNTFYPEWLQRIIQKQETLQCTQNHNYLQYRDDYGNKCKCYYRSHSYLNIKKLMPEQPTRLIKTKLYV